MKKTITIRHPFKKRKNNHLAISHSNIIYEDSKLENFISSWLSLRGWYFDTFPHILDTLGIDKPVILFGLDGDTFYAKTQKNNRYLKITLSKKVPTIEVEECGMTILYSINFKFNSTISLQLTPIKKKIMYKNKKDLICLYSSSYHYSLKIDDYVLDIDKSFEFELPKKTKEIEEYLLTLEPEDFIYDVSVVYLRIKKILKSNNTILIECSKLRANNNPSIITSKMYINSNFRLTEFAISKPGDGTYHILENGDWKWRSEKNNCQVSYWAKNRSLSISIRGKYNVLAKEFNPIDFLDNVILEISMLKKDWSSFS